MNKLQLFQKLSTIGALRRVTSRDGLDKIIVVDPWLVANHAFIRASRWSLAVASICVLLGLLTPVHGFLLGVSTDILVVAMLTRIAAPAMSGLTKWNDFVVLGETDDFAATEITPAAPSELADEEERLRFRNSLASAYALVATADTPTRNPADSVLKGLTNFTRAQMALVGAEALWGMRRKPTGFFATCTALGTLAVVAMIILLEEEFSSWMILIGPFAFWTGAILYALNAPKWFRGRIMPYRGNLLMHQSKALNDAMSSKVILGLAASAMVGVHVWVLIAFCRYFVTNTGIREFDPVVESNYPTPLPRVEQVLIVFPVSVLCGLLTLANYGSPSTNTWLSVLVLLVPGVLGLASMVVGRSTDIVRYLSEGTNSLILFEPNLAQQSSENPRRQEFSDALRAGIELDHALDYAFKASPEALPHRMT